MKLVIFGLGISSAWGNGHATLMRGLLRALIRRGHAVAFFEKDVPYYAAHRDLYALPGGELILYPDWQAVEPLARRELCDADAAMVTSYCADALAATDTVLSASRPLRIFYDLDAPVTLDNLACGRAVSYIGPRGLRDFDLVLSYTGGRTLDELKRVLGARQVRPLFGSVDPQVHYPVEQVEDFRCDLSYLGTFAADRQAKVEALFASPAQRLPDRRFVLGGPNYDGAFPWSPNIIYRPHVAPANHPPFYCSSRLTLNVTRNSMAAMGYCPSARLFEAAACGTPLLSDEWEGLGTFFEPGTQILLARSTDDVVQALSLSDAELACIAREARERALAEHTSERRALEFERIVERAIRPLPVQSMEA